MIAQQEKSTVPVEFQNHNVQASETARIADQLRRVYAGPSWLGPALTTILSDVTQDQAARWPIGNAHAIWELVLHITAWMRIARERLAATQIRDETESENWPPMAGSWQDTVDALEREERQLEQAILSFPEERLNEPALLPSPRRSTNFCTGLCSTRPITRGKSFY
jgi:DinB superfamily